MERWWFGRGLWRVLLNIICFGGHSLENSCHLLTAVSRTWQREVVSLGSGVPSPAWNKWAKWTETSHTIDFVIKPWHCFGQT